MRRRRAVVLREGLLDERAVRLRGEVARRPRRRQGAGQLGVVVRPRRVVERRAQPLGLGALLVGRPERRDRRSGRADQTSGASLDGGASWTARSRFGAAFGSRARRAPCACACIARWRTTSNVAGVTSSSRATSSRGSLLEHAQPDGARVAGVDARERLLDLGARRLPLAVLARASGRPASRSAPRRPRARRPRPPRARAACGPGAGRAPRAAPPSRSHGQKPTFCHVKRSMRSTTRAYTSDSASRAAASEPSRGRSTLR